jgi:ABC-type glutathione transport system ATPase component
MHPKVMFFDAPTSALDPELVGGVLNAMRGLARTGMTMIVVTHEARFAEDVADRIVFMADGVVVEHGQPAEIIHNCRYERTKAFMQRIAGVNGHQPVRSPPSGCRGAAGFLRSTRTTAFVHVVVFLFDAKVMA